MKENGKQRNIVVEKDGKSIWAKLTGYNRRVIAESAMAHRKRLYGGELKSRCEIRGKIEVKLKAILINKLIDLAT